MLMDLNGPRLAPLSGGKPASLVVLLHGVAANGNDLLYLARFWQKLLPEAEFAMPNAPFPSGDEPSSRQWFSLEDRAPGKLLAGLRESDTVLDSFLDRQLAKLALDDAHLALAGFSQGAAMALYAGLRRRRRIAAVVSFSGALPLADGLFGDIRSKPLVLLVHGAGDDVVPFPAMAATRDMLEAAAVPVRVLARDGLGHEIDGDGAAFAGDFLHSVLTGCGG
jgi:phospholipase/carboxylesterase